MTMEPLENQGPFPSPQCPLHEKALKEIKTIVLETRNEVRSLTDMKGPIAELQSDVKLVKAEIQDTKDDVEKVKKDVSNVERAQTALIIKAGAILGPVAAAIAAWIATLMGK